MSLSYLMKLMSRGAILGISSAYFLYHRRNANLSDLTIDNLKDSTKSTNSNLFSRIEHKLRRNLNIDQRYNAFSDKNDEKSNLSNPPESNLNKSNIFLEQEIKDLRSKLDESQATIANYKNELIIRSQELDSNSSNNENQDKDPLRLYSDILNYLQEFNEHDFNILDHLPRVIVVGDQSSGKTSVLEMLIDAHIFPRGSGKMMTRSPIQVTLCESQRHIAKFKNSNREYNLKDNLEVDELRSEIERRMLNQIESHQTVSDRPIYLDISGPGLHRMILIDLPGLITTVTKDLVLSTKDDIEMMVKNQIKNPNSIILCIQDGSIDAERSSVTKIVSEADPDGQRTIFVLNKSDLAEKNLTKHTVEKILNGKLFPMKAKAYFAIVSGTDNHSATIKDIKKYEKYFFDNSKFFKNINDEFKSSDNFSKQVSICFWNIVRNSLTKQIDDFSRMQNSLEITWRNNYNNCLEIDRDEMFERIRAKFLDSFNHLYEVKENFWFDHVKTFVKKALAEDLMVNTLVPCYINSNYDKFKNANNYDFSTNLTLDLNNIMKNDLLQTITKICNRFLLHQLEDKFNETIRLSADNSLFCKVFTNFWNHIKKNFDEKFEWSFSTQNYFNLLLDNYIDDNRIDMNRKWEDLSKKACALLRMPISKIEIDFVKKYGFMPFIKLSERLDYEIESIKNLNGIDGLKSKLNDKTQKEIIVKLNDISNIIIEKDKFTEIWMDYVKLWKLKYLIENIKQCQYLYAYYKTKNLDKISVNCDALEGFNSLFNLSENLSSIIVTKFFQKELKSAENCIKRIFFDINSNLVLKADLLNHQQIIHAEKLKIVRTICQRLKELNLILEQQKIL